MFEKRGILTLWLFKDKNRGAGEVVQGLGMQTTLQRTRVLVPVQFYSQAAHNRLCSSSRGSRTLFWPQYTLVHVHMYVETRVKLKIYILGKADERVHQGDGKTENWEPFGTQGPLTLLLLVLKTGRRCH